MEKNLDDGILNIAIPAYNAENFIEECLDSIYNQTWKGKIKITVCVDGCEKTKKKVESILHKYDNVTALYCEENKGTYITLNTILSTLSDGNILVFGADDIMCPDMVDEVFKTKRLGFVKYHGVLIAPVKYIKEFGGFMPWRCAGDTELLSRIGRDKTKWHSYPRMFFRREHENQITTSKKYGYDTDIRKQYIKFIEKNRPKKIIPEVNEYKVLKRKDISFNIATYPPREKHLKKVIENVIDKVDILRVCLNEYKKVPKWLSLLDVECVIPKINLKDKGKFLWSKDKRNEIYFTGDDDLLYSDAYFREHLKNLKGIVSSHGRTLKPDAKSLTDCVKYGACLKNLDEGFQANIAGTGVMAFDLSEITINIDDVKCEGMTDLGVAVYASEKNIPLYVRQHKASELEYLLDDKEETLWSANLKDERQEKLIKQINIKTGIRTFVLNKKEETERLSLFQKEAEKSGIEFEVFHAVPFGDPRIQNELKEIIKDSTVNATKVTCEISNRISFSDILKKSYQDHVIIFEDDTEFEPESKKVIENVLKELPEDFGVCYLGCYLRKKTKLSKYSKSLVKIDNAEKIWGVTGVIYSKKIRKFLSERLLSNESDLTDFEIVKSILPNHDCFIANPMICWQSTKAQQITKYKMHGDFDFPKFKKQSLMYFSNGINGV